MNAATKKKAVKYLKNEIKTKEGQLQVLHADLQALEEQPPEIPKWQAMIMSAWHTEGEPNWDGTIEAPTVRDAVYIAMLEFCKKAGRVYPGYKNPGANNVYDHFDVQGTVYLGLKLPSGSVVPVDRDTLDKLTKGFNNHAPMPKRPPRKEPVGLT